jgi:membrane-associated phospholipid phosphatase
LLGNLTISAQVVPDFAPVEGMENLGKKTALTAGITFIIYLVLFFWVDRAVDLWIHNHWAQTWVFQAGTYGSCLAQGSYIKLGLALGLILIIIIDPGLQKKWTRNLLYICVTGACAIIIGDGLKYLLGRYRPVMLFEHNLYGLHFFASKWALNSTPSGHTLRAFSLLTALSLLQRRFTVIFLSLAALIGVSRVMVTDHYPSDVLFGAFIGIFAALWAYKYFFIKDNAAKKVII